jgi:H+-translocating NAD(P) transhydrogenase subunit alpha
VKLFVPRESQPGETRVALTPETATRLVKLGATVQLERGAGAGMSVSDQAYAKVGVELVDDSAWGQADLVAKVQPPTLEEIERLKEGAQLVSFMLPASHLPQVRRMAARRVTSFAMDLVPRITRAQSADALSSQATVAGYKAVIVGAAHLPKLCPLLMTAAGTIAPARAVIFGAGVAGLQAIATARRLGCVVEATDIRLAAKEQVESLGARFIDVPGAEDMETAGGYAKEVSEDFLRRQREEVAKRVSEADLVITTAQVPGRKAPVLVSDAMLAAMRPGSVVVDLAVESGGNVMGSVLGEVVTVHGVTVVGLANLPATVPVHASELYSKNVLALVRLMFTKDGAFAPNLEDEVLAGCLLTHAGEVVHAGTQLLLQDHVAAGARRGIRIDVEVERHEPESRS